MRTRQTEQRRPRRYDGHGNVFCHHCKQYRAADHFTWMTSPSLNRPRYSAYCRDCARELDRLRWCGERRRRNNASRTARQRRQKDREYRERTAFVANAILTLRKRGLTKADICRLAQVSFSSLLLWERRDRRPLPNVAERFVVLLRATAELPEGEPAYRRRLPHPAFDELLAATEGAIAALPVRNRWGK
jgi:transcriptional regulator with XRE-family HTH domain